MPKIVITHSVADVETWLNGKSERAAAIGNMGATNVVDHIAQDGSKTIAITFNVDDVETVTSTLASPPAEVAAAMERHGVLPPLTVYVEA
jgi:glycerophosphoryl diester phosphodiesterase